MQLIEFGTSKRKDSTKISQNYINSKPYYPAQSKRNSVSSKFFFCESHHSFVIIMRKHLKEKSDRIFIQYALIRNLIFKCQVLEQLWIFIRYFLKLSNTLTKVTPIVCPKTGEVIFNVNLLIPSNYDISSQTQLQIMDIISDNVRVQLEQLVQILQFLIKKQNLSREKIEYYESLNQLNHFKSYIKVSPYYAWNILDNKTYNINQKNKIYETSKKKFNEKVIILEKSSDIVDHLDMVYINPTGLYKSFYNLTEKQDIDLFQNCLARSYPITKNQQQITHITLDDHTLKQLLISQELKIKCLEFQNSIKIAVKKIQDHEINDYIYEKSIIERIAISKGQFLGIPKYYIIKGKAQETANYSFTNHTSVKRLRKYLERNSICISLLTKLQILNQLINILRFLRDNLIVYHNFRPERIVIRKGIILSIFDFSNSFHHAVKIKKNYQFQQTKPSSYKLNKPCASIYPYVANYKIDQEDSWSAQKSDSFSFGMVMYEILYNRNPYFMKQSKLKQNFNKEQDLQIRQKLEKKILASEYFPIFKLNFFNLLTSLSLECLSHKLKQIEPEISDTSSDWSIIQSEPRQKITLINQRPHLDWIAIIIKKILNYVVNIF